ncbi:hypothetical protein [Salinivibrio proteolyticus]|uniref:Uncharacterized protein n=1 Tax=Salinivibrio proteolyticus TaxID=334715 RepID=A0ABY7LGM2_9GAMM|nr:hypothetical protein [Salinivibrio proteolyticus]WBA15489.1 hypothetical protein N7E60_04120 [Salinivibrio proteolyticus]
MAIFDHLCEYHTDKFNPGTRRTLKRRNRKWSSLHGPAKEVVFIQTHEYGALGITDFTHVKSPASGWAFIQVIYGDPARVLQPSLIDCRIRYMPPAVCPKKSVPTVCQCQFKIDPLIDVIAEVELTHPRN